MTFGEFVAFYGLTRVRGRGAALPVRRLPGAAARRSRDDARTEEVEDVIEWLGELVRQVDSSLLDEWEQLTDRSRARRDRRSTRRGPADAAPAVTAQRAGVHA